MRRNASRQRSSAHRSAAYAERRPRTFAAVAPEWVASPSDISDRPEPPLCVAAIVRTFPYARRTATAVLPDLDRHPRVGESREPIGEGASRADELKDPVTVEMFHLMSRLAPVPGGGLVAVPRARIDTTLQAAVRAPAPQRNRDLRVTVTINVANVQRAPVDRGGGFGATTSAASRDHVAKDDGTGPLDRKGHVVEENTVSDRTRILLHIGNRR